jgi:hypothetical protein
MNTNDIDQTGNRNRKRNRDGKLSAAVLRRLREDAWRPTRDLATRLLGDPFAAEQIVERAFGTLANLKAEDVNEEKAEGMLADIVVGLCLAANNCVRCANEEYELERGEHREHDEDDPEFDEDPEDIQVPEDQDPEDAEETGDEEYDLDDEALDDEAVPANDNGEREDVA